MPTCVEKINTELTFVFEGYKKIYTLDTNEEKILSLTKEQQFAGDFPFGIQGIFCFKYSIRHNDKEMVRFSIALTDEEAVELEDVLLRERENRRMKSMTYYSGNVYMTCIVGSMPLISLLNKDMSFSFAKGDDYDKLLLAITSFLDKKDLIPELESRRNKNL